MTVEVLLNVVALVLVCLLPLEVISIATSELHSFVTHRATCRHCCLSYERVYFLEDCRLHAHVHTAT